MVLITLMLACMHAKPPATVLPAAPVATVVTLASPESAQVVAPPESVKKALNQALESSGLSIIDGAKASDIQALGTPSGQITALTKAAKGEMSVLVAATARPRAELSGRFPWQIDLTITVAKTGREPLRDTVRIPVSLTYIHQGEADALAAASTQIARRTTLLVERFRKDQ